METTTKKFLISKVNEIRDIQSLAGLKKEIVPLLDKISKEECPQELKQLQSIIDEINKLLLTDHSNTDLTSNLAKTKRELADVLCDLLCT